MRVVLDTNILFSALISAGRGMGQKAPLPKSVSLRSHAGAMRQSA